MTSRERWQHSLPDCIAPGLQGLCFLFAVGVVQKLLDLPVIVNAIGFIGLGVGFLVATRRFFAKKPPPGGPK